MVDQQLEFHFELLQPDTDPTGKIICAVTQCNAFHVETKVRGRFFSAHFDTGVRFIDELENQGDPKYWDIIVVPELSNDLIEAWCESRVGRRYDFFGAFQSGLRERDPSLPPIHDTNKDFCSLCGKEVGSRANIQGLDAMPCPGTLRSNLWAHNGELRASELITLDFDKDLQNRLADLVSYGEIDPSIQEKILACCV